MANRRGAVLRPAVVLGGDPDSCWRSTVPVGGECWRNGLGVAYLLYGGGGDFERRFMEKSSGAS